MRITRLFLVMALTTLVGAVGAYAEVSQTEFNTLMENYLKSEEGPEKLSEALQNHFQKKQAASMKKQEDQAKAESEAQFKNPVKIDIGEGPVKGPKDAKVTIIEFSDFQCPYCSRGKQVMEEVLKAYPKDVKLVFKHLPLPFHDQAMPAAKAAVAAQKQGKFWEMHDELFENQQKLSPEFFEATAKKLGLDMTKFKADMAAPATEELIKADSQLAKANNIQGTPGFFVNGVAVKGAYPLEHFKGIIDRWLKGA